ncbi:Crp/Fnr family transcriptional regulator [Clostridium aminobutyricum]|uniref:Crp/Fnr family transcriptional regulator n=1 Tax=Clostridium aminobutyricum TaxID=33953 RepID=A0A939DBA0_CLOAM|nr:Crp/Fnr family transcriptional regulator [Clostridium aminobutyricum]MBN7774128.1 Crp/Fnr family transcriptional regulator [Clostridium aminobutyricum]
MSVKNEAVFAELYPFWNALTPSQQLEMMEGTTLRSFEPGDHVHNAGQCTGVLGILFGRLRVYLLSDTGKEVTLFRLMDGDTCMLSASCIIKNISFDIYVSAETKTELLLISSAVYDKIANENPKAESFMKDIISMRFSEAMWIVEQLLFMKLDRRVSIFLLEQSALDESDIITLTHEQIANHLGTAREVISRMLKYMSKEGLLSVSRKGITILDRKALMALAN